MKELSWKLARFGISAGVLGAVGMALGFQFFDISKENPFQNPVFLSSVLVISIGSILSLAGVMGDKHYLEEKYGKSPSVGLVDLTMMTGFLKYYDERKEIRSENSEDLEST